MATTAPLTEKQQKVLDLLGEGKSNAEVAAAMGIQPSGVISHVKAIEKKGYSAKPKRHTAKPKPPTRRKRAVAAGPEVIAATNGSDGQLVAEIAKAYEQQIGALDAMRTALKDAITTHASHIDSIDAQVNELSGRRLAHVSAVEDLSARLERMTAAVAAL